MKNNDKAILDLAAAGLTGKMDALYAARDSLRQIIRAAIIADPDSVAAAILRTADLESKV